MSACYPCGSPLVLPAPEEEEQSVRCPNCGMRTIIAGRRNVREAGARRTVAFWRAQGFRLPPSVKWEKQGRYPGETDEAHARRVAILEGRNPDEVPR